MTNKTDRRVQLRDYGDDYHVSYLELADHPHQLESGIVARSVFLHQLISDYDGPGLILQFDAAGKAIGIEILYSYADWDGVEEEEDRTGDTA